MRRYTTDLDKLARAINETDEGFSAEVSTNAKNKICCSWKWDGIEGTYEKFDAHWDYIEAIEYLERWISAREIQAASEYDLVYTGWADSVVERIENVTKWALIPDPEPEPETAKVIHAVPVSLGDVQDIRFLMGE